MQAPEVPDSALKPTKTFCVLVAATRAGPEFAKPATPPTAMLVPEPLIWIEQIDVLRAEIGGD